MPPKATTPMMVALDCWLRDKLLLSLAVVEARPLSGDGAAGQSVEAETETDLIASAGAATPSAGLSLERWLSETRSLKTSALPESPWQMPRPKVPAQICLSVISSIPMSHWMRPVRWRSAASQPFRFCLRRGPSQRADAVDYVAPIGAQRLDWLARLDQANVVTEGGALVARMDYQLLDAHSRSNCMCFDLLSDALARQFFSSMTWNLYFWPILASNCLLYFQGNNAIWTCCDSKSASFSGLLQRNLARPSGLVNLACTANATRVSRQVPTRQWRLPERRGATCASERVRVYITDCASVRVCRCASYRLA